MKISILNSIRSHLVAAFGLLAIIIAVGLIALLAHSQSAQNTMGENHGRALLMLVDLLEERELARLHWKEFEEKETRPIVDGFYSSGPLNDNTVHLDFRFYSQPPFDQIDIELNSLESELLAGIGSSSKNTDFVSLSGSGGIRRTSLIRATNSCLPCHVDLDKANKDIDLQLGDVMAIAITEITFGVDEKK